MSICMRNSSLRHLRSMCVRLALLRNGNFLVGSLYRISCIVQNIISLSSVLVHVEQLCDCFIENHSLLPVASAALIGKTSRTSRETLHEWKRNNTCSPPTIFSGHVARQNCSPALRLIYDSVVEKGEIRAALPNADTHAVSDGRSYQVATSLGYLVHALWQLDVSPRDVVAYEGPLPWRSIKWLTFQCPEPTCPYVAMIRERTRLLDQTEDQQGT